MNLTASCSYRIAMARLIFKWPNMRSILLTGLLNPTLMKMLSDPEAEKADLESRLARYARRSRRALSALRLQN